MSEAATLPPLIDDIYDAALDPTRWVHALTKIANFVGGEAGGLCTKSVDDEVINVDHIAGIDRRCMQAYAQTYCAFDPLINVPLFDVRQVVSIPELVPYDDYRQGPFYQEWAHPQGWGDVASVVLEKSAQGCTFLNVVRTEATGMVDDSVRQRMRLVTPHARRAVLIGQAIDRRADEAAAFVDILDALSVGVFLVANDLRIIHTNAAGREILRANDVMRSIGGLLVARDQRVHRTLRDLCTAKGAADDGPGNGLPLTTEDGECYVAHVLSLNASARRRAVAAGATAAVFVRKAALDALSTPEVIGRTYNLTPTELRVLLGIVDIGGIPEVATALGVSNTTVRTHVCRLFEKTGVSRQADLVKIVAAFSSPLVA